MSRLNELLQQAGNIGRNEDDSITRLGFSEKYFQALEFLKGRMQELGMQVETDPVGNLQLTGYQPDRQTRKEIRHQCPDPGRHPEYGRTSQIYRRRQAFVRYPEIPEFQPRTP